MQKSDVALVLEWANEQEFQIHSHITKLIQGRRWTILEYCDPICYFDIYGIANCYESIIIYEKSACVSKESFERL